jgi:hypothetical protein
MYRYTIAEDYWDDYKKYELIHEQIYSKEEFQNICKKAFKELDIKNRKEIIQSRASFGISDLIKILTKNYGFIIPDNIIVHLHLKDLFNIEDNNCEYCDHSYSINGNLKCNFEDCDMKELL